MVALKLSVPKRIGGVRLPKPMRRRLKRLSESKSGRATIAEALVAAGSVLEVLEPPAPAAAKAPKVPKAAKASKPAKAPKPRARASGKPLATAPA